MIETTVYDCSIVQLPVVRMTQGNITAINSSIEVPFDIKRVYYLYDIPGGESRGGHAHKELKQLIVAASGSFNVTLDDGTLKRTFMLSRPNTGLLVMPGLWRELDTFSSGAILLVLASQAYQEEDYLRDYEKFLKYKNR
jgi:hypothetical protein